MDWLRLRCPSCASGLSELGDPVQCPGCGARWRVDEGIPQFTIPLPGEFEDDWPVELHEASFVKQNKAYFLYWGRLQAVERLIGDLIRTDPPTRVLDAGCGTGYVSARLQELGAEVVGVEASPVPLRYAHERHVNKVYGAFSEKLPFEDGQFDLALSLDVYEHLDDDAPGIAEAYRVLKPGGAHLVFVPAMKFLWSRCDEFQGHKRRYTTTLLKRALEQAGFEVERLTYLLPTFLAPAVVVRTANRLLLPQKKGLEAAWKEYTMPPTWLNNILKRIVATETCLLTRLDFPFGVTAAALAVKPLGAGQRR